MFADPHQIRRAINPQSLRTLVTAERAIIEATLNARARNAHPDTCPAVKLLLRHAQRIRLNQDIDVSYPEDRSLKIECAKLIETIEKTATLSDLFHSIATDANAWPLYKRRLRTGLFSLTELIEPDADKVTITMPLKSTDKAIVTAPSFYLTVAPGFIPDHDIMFRRKPHLGPDRSNPNHYAGITALNNPVNFAKIITETLKVGHD